MKSQPVKNLCVFIGGKQIGANCLRQLLQRGVRPRLVIGNLDDDGKDKSWHESLVKAAKQARLPTIEKRKVREPAILERIKNIQPEIIFCIGGMQIIPPEVLAIPRLGTLNVHPALLPKYRGRYSTAHAIFNGEKTTGVTVHWMDEGIDSGPIILQEKIKIIDEILGTDLEHRILHLDPLTAATVARYMNNQGEVYGVKSTPDQFIPNNLSKITPLKNAILASHYTFGAGGVPGALNEGKDAARMILEKLG